MYQALQCDKAAQHGREFKTYNTKVVAQRHLWLVVINTAR